ncbi:MAG: glycosyltransferase, partial [Clostridiaceae bacterium]|nr:glycosyltransferase [Clostridiaceae bacterium]
MKILYNKLLSISSLIQKGILSIRREGVCNSIAKAKHYLLKNKDVLTFGITEGEYNIWLNKEILADNKIQDEIKESLRKPLISIIIPVFNVDPNWLALAIKSVKNQLYENWELCLVDDCSTNQSTINYLRSINDKNIKIKYFNENRGISAASNAALKMATGEYIALMDHDDEITKDALFEVVKAINKENPDLIYSDEDKIDKNGNKKNPFFKPDWSPDLLRSQNYICHFAVIRKKLMESIKGFRQGYEGAQDHDLFLRISEKTNNIYHIPKVLYSWREIETSITYNSLSKPYAQLAGLKAVNDHLNRVFNNSAYAEEKKYLFVYETRFPIKNIPLVSIIIPAIYEASYLKTCVNSILTESTYNNYEIIILLNYNSLKIKTKSWLKDLLNKHSRVKIIDINYPLFCSKLYNLGIMEAKGDVFIFLDNNTKVISKDWIEKLSEQAVRDDVGVVGPLLLYKNGSIQHAGLVMLNKKVVNIFQGMKSIHIGSPYVSPMVKRNVLAVSSSCLAISRKTIDRIGMFDESFKYYGSDIEIC